MSEFKCSLCRREIAVHQREHGINWYSCLNSKCALRHYLFGREAIEALCNHKPEPGQPAAVQHSDDIAVDNFCIAMKEKLAKKRAQGRDGWQECPPEDLTTMLVKHIAKGDPVDVANFAMMLHQTGNKLVASEYDYLRALRLKINEQPAAGQSEPVAWMTPDGRVASAETKAALPPACREELSIPLDVRTIPAAPAVPVVGWLYHNPHLSEKCIGFKYGPDRPDERESWKPLAIVEQQDNTK